MPLTEFQQQLLVDLATESPDDSGYLAGGAAIHFAPDSTRFSRDLDFFHDSVERVASAFALGRAHLEARGYALTVTLSQPGFVRAIVTRGAQSTRVDWAPRVTMARTNPGWLRVTVSAYPRASRCALPSANADATRSTES